MTDNTLERASRRRDREKISIRAISRVTGVSFSTLARGMRGEGSLDAENTRRIKLWLGDDVSSELSSSARKSAEEISMVAARAFAVEITKIIREELGFTP